MRVTYLLSNTAGIGLMACRNSAIGSRSLSSSTPAFFAAVYASSGIGSHAPNTMSSSAAIGTKSLIKGERFSVRLPRRIVAICVSDPIGFESPRRMLSTPAMNVVATAPRPGVRMPSLPVAGRTVERAPDSALFELLDDTYSISFQQSAGDAAPPPQPTRTFSFGESQRFGFCSRCGLVIDERDALDHGDPRRHGQENDDEREHPSVQCQPEKGLWHREQHHALRALQYAHLRIEAKRFRASPRVRGEEGADDSREADDHHRYTPMHRTQSIEHSKPAEHRAVCQTVKRGIEKGAEGRAAVRPSRYRAVEHVEERRQPEKEAADRDVAGAI